MIWNAAIIPRVLYTNPDCHYLFVESSVPVPAVLHVCQEARKEALKIYKQVSIINTLKVDPEVLFYISETDILYFQASYCGVNPCNIMHDLSCESSNYITDRVRHVALAACDELPQSWLSSHSQQLDAICNFKNLEDITIVVGRRPNPYRNGYPYNQEDAKFREALSAEEDENFKDIEKNYSALIKTEQEKRGLAWKAPKLIVKGLVIGRTKRAI